MLLVKIGQGKEPAGTVKKYLEILDDEPAQGLAPAHGLSLIEVELLTRHSVSGLDYPWTTVE